jgi:hypothetical protein
MSAAYALCHRFDHVAQAISLRLISIAFVSCSHVVGKRHLFASYMLDHATRQHLQVSDLRQDAQGLAFRTAGARLWRFLEYVAG